MNFRTQFKIYKKTTLEISLWIIQDKILAWVCIVEDKTVHQYDLSYKEPSKILEMNLRWLIQQLSHTTRVQLTG